MTKQLPTKFQELVEGLKGEMWIIRNREDDLETKDTKKLKFVFNNFSNWELYDQYINALPVIYYYNIYNF